MTKAPTQERVVVLARWLAASRERFDTEEKIRIAAGKEIDADGIELDWIAHAWQSGHAAGPVVDEVTGEILEEEIPWETEEPEPAAASNGGELVAVDRDVPSLFGSGGIDLALEQARLRADRIKQLVIDSEQTLEMEDGSHYVLAPGVEAGCAFHGIFAVVESTEPYKDGWKARAYAHQPSTGERWTSRDAICLRSEKGKGYKTDNELLQTAETRAARKALVSASAPIWALTGLEITPPDERAASPRQRALLGALWRELDQVKPRGKDGWKNYTTRGAIMKYGKRLSAVTQGEMNLIIGRMQEILDELTTAAGGGADPGPDDVEAYQPTEAELAEAQGIEF